MMTYEFNNEKTIFKKDKQRHIMTEEQAVYEYQFIIIENNYQLERYQENGWIMPEDLNDRDFPYSKGEIIKIKRKIKSGTAQ